RSGQSRPDDRAAAVFTSPVTPRAGPASEESAELLNDRLGLLLDEIMACVVDLDNLHVGSLMRRYRVQQSEEKSGGQAEHRRCYLPVRAHVGYICVECLVPAVTAFDGSGIRIIRRVDGATDIVDRVRVH